MTIQHEDTPSSLCHQHRLSLAIPAPRQPCDDDQTESVLFLGGWQAHLRFAKHDGAVDPYAAAASPVVETVRPDLRSKLSARYRVYRLNRAFRRNQREFDRAMDCIVHDVAGQRELQTSWTLRH